MEIANELLGESFSYQYSGEALTCRMVDQENLDEILEFCQDIGEMACFEFARHGRALTGASPEHAQIVGSV